MDKLKPMTVGELLDALNMDITNGKVSREEKVIIYSASGRNAIALSAGITHSGTEYNGTATLIMAYAK